jgi:hypothetical protein
MNDLIEHCDEDHFANSQSCRDLRVSSGAAEVEIQLIESIDNVGDFVGFIQISTRVDTIKPLSLF